MITRQPTGSRYRRKDGYVSITLDGGPVLEHRVVWERAHGAIPTGYQIHHRNGIRADNRLENLELIHIVDHATLHYGTRPGDPRTGRFRSTPERFARY